MCVASHLHLTEGSDVHSQLVFGLAGVRTDSSPACLDPFVGVPGWITPLPGSIETAALHCWADVWREDPVGGDRPRVGLDAGRGAQPGPGPGGRRRVWRHEPATARHVWAAPISPNGDGGAEDSQPRVGDRRTRCPDDGGQPFRSHPRHREAPSMLEPGELSSDSGGGGRGPSPVRSSRSLGSDVASSPRLPAGFRRYADASHGPGGGRDGAGRVGRDSRSLCFAFRRGNCRYGDGCIFVHDAALAPLRVDCDRGGRANAGGRSPARPRGVAAAGRGGRSGARDGYGDRGRRDRRSLSCERGAGGGAAGGDSVGRVGFQPGRERSRGRDSLDAAREQCRGSPPPNARAHVLHYGTPGNRPTVGRYVPPGRRPLAAAAAAHGAASDAAAADGPVGVAPGPAVYTIPKKRRSRGPPAERGD